MTRSRRRCALDRRITDPLVHWTRHYASDYLRHQHRKIGEVDISEARLRHLESSPNLPKFYRRSATD